MESLRLELGLQALLSFAEETTRASGDLKLGACIGRWSLLSTNEILFTYCDSAVVAPLLFELRPKCPCPGGLSGSVLSRDPLSAGGRR